MIVRPGFVICPQNDRRGVTVVEFAIVGPIVFLLLILIMVGGIAVFRYHTVAHAAREGSRYASVHAGQYERDTEKPAADNESVQEFILTKAPSLEAALLTCDVQWRYPDKMPLRADDDSDPPGQKALANTVTVTLTYEWNAFPTVLPPFQIVSSSEMPVAY